MGDHRGKEGAILYDVVKVHFCPIRNTYYILECYIVLEIFEEEIIVDLWDIEDTCKELVSIFLEGYGGLFGFVPPWGS